MIEAQIREWNLDSRVVILTPFSPQAGEHSTEINGKKQAHISYSIYAFPICLP